MRPLALVLLAGLGLACERQQGAADQAGAGAGARAQLDAGALRASAVDGLEAAAADPVLAAKLGLARALEQARALDDRSDASGLSLQSASERLLARVGAEPQLSGASERLFADLQDSPAMRGALADYARANPELELSDLSEGFVAHIDERLTRPAVADAIASALRTELRQADAALTRALLIDGGGAELLGAAILLRLADPPVRAELEARLGREPAALQQRLERRLADPGRIGALIELLGEAARSEAGLSALVELLDHPRSATQLAAALTRALDQAELRARAAGLFGRAIAEEFDERGFRVELQALVHEGAVVGELARLREALAREAFVRERIAGLIRAVTEAPDFSDTLLEALAGPA